MNRIRTTQEIKRVYVLAPDNLARDGKSDWSMVADEQFDRWYTAAREDARRAGARQALLDYADLLEGPTYTMNYGSARGYREMLLGLLRRDADLLYGATSSGAGTEDANA